jgi:hypothetical protein
VSECFKIEFEKEPGYQVLKHLLLTTLLNKEQSPTDVFDWSNFETTSPNPKSKMWEIQMELKDEETENLNEHKDPLSMSEPLLEGSLVPRKEFFWVDNQIRSYRMKPK